jgi:hypothetical protein
MRRFVAIVPSFALMIAAATSITAMRSNASDDSKFRNRPANAQPGECWCLFTVPATYKTVSEQVMVEPASCSFEMIPAVFEPRSERVLVCKETKKQIKIPATFKTESYQALVSGESCRTEKIPAVYEDRSETVMVRKASQRRISVPAVHQTESYQVCSSPARNEWKKTDCEGKSAGGDLKMVSGECWCLVTIPAVFETRTRDVCVSKESCVMETIPAEFKTVCKKVCVKPEGNIKIAVPAVYETRTREVCDTKESCTTEVTPAVYKNVEKNVCVKDASKRRIEIPARYETRTREVCVTQETKVWRKTECDANNTGVIK